MDPQVVVELLEEHPEPAAFFEACERRGLSLSEVVDLLLEPYAHLGEDDAWRVEDIVVYDWGSLPYHLVEALGAERAEAIERESKLLDGVAARHERLRKLQEVSRLIESRAPLSDVLGLLPPTLPSQSFDPVEHDIDMVPVTIARTYSLRDLALACRHLDPMHRDAMRRPIVGRVSPLQAYEELVELEAEVVREAFAVWWDIHVETGRDDEVRLRLLAAATRAELRPFNEVARHADAHMPAARWIPILRSCGLKAAQAALILLEREVSVTEVVGLLTSGGYDDDAVLTALLENGVGTRSSLELLRSSGWSLPRMVESLHAREVLLPDVREHLVELGVPKVAQRPLLMAHWELELVDLVLRQERARKTQPR